MAVFSNLLRSIGLANSKTVQTTIPAGFEPLDAEQLKRMQAGFETEDDSGEDDPPPEEPPSGELPPEEGGDP